MPLCELTTNANSWGFCLLQKIGFGSVDMAGLIIIGIFMMLMLFGGVPISVMFPIGTVLLFTIYVMTNSPVFLALFAVSLVITAAMIVNGIRRHTE